MNTKAEPFTLDEATEAARSDAESALARVYERARQTEDHNVFIHRVSFEAAMTQLAEQRERLASGERLPLYGVPFAVKDNIDVEGMPTTAACPAFSYRAKHTAPAVARLLRAGAVVVGKTNLDQFATGLVGVRSPYGVCRSAIDAEYISGGSSSGSALAVALGLVPFALGTDTAGSGRVPAAFNGIVGLKPTRGLISTRGVVPACRSLDCVSIFAHSSDDAGRLLDLLVEFDEEDEFARRMPVPPSANFGPPRIGVARDLEFFGNQEFEREYAAFVARLQHLGFSCVFVDVEPLVEAGRLLYGGPWVAERFASVGEFIERAADAVHPAVREIILAGKRPLAYQLFRAEYDLMALRRRSESIWESIDVLALPTTGTIYRVDEVLADPVELNSRLGRYTNFANLLDLSALAVPAAITPSGAPFGISLIAPAFDDARLIELAKGLLP